MDNENHSRLYEKSGGRRIPLYAEVGRYFTPDGHFESTTFRDVIREYLNEIKSQNQSSAEFHTSARQWLTSYLEEVMDYLDEKDMGNASYQLFNIAMEECAEYGVDSVSFNPARIKRFMAMARENPDIAERSRVSRDDKRKKIFDAALQVFSEDGFHRATIDRIASVSGVGKGSVYRYFPSKEELLDQLLTESFAVIVDRVSRELSTDGDILSQVRTMIEFWVTYIGENPQVYRLIQSESMSQQSGGRNLFYDYLITHLPMLKERIVSLNKNGKLKTTGFYTVFYGVLGFIDGVVTKWFRSGMDYSLRDEVPIILEVLFNGFVGEQWTQQRFYIPPEEDTNTTPS